MRVLGSMVLLSCMLACSGRPLDQGEASGSAGSSDGTVGAASLDHDDGPVPTTSPGTTLVTTGSVDESTDDGVIFLSPPDLDDTGIECNIFEQDCARGFKCVVVSRESPWDGTTCVPVVEDPQGPGEPCVLEDPATGVDDCGWAQICWAVDESGMGQCLGLCLATEPGSGDVYCEDPLAEVSTCQTCPVCLCIPPCDPLQQDCGDGQGCYPVNDQWQCAPDASRGAGQDSPCEFINVCTPGTVCMDDSAVPTCEPQGAAGCCTTICDTSVPNPCPGQELGMECVPWYPEGGAPVGLETVGICVMP